jgi:hypothetical protein
VLYISKLLTKNKEKSDEYGKDVKKDFITDIRLSLVGGGSEMIVCDEDKCSCSESEKSSS